MHIKTKNNICEVCDEHILTDIHHIISKSKGGLNIESNKCELCPSCHRRVHTGDIVLEGRFLTSNCKMGETELIWRKPNEPSINGIFDDPNVSIIKCGNKENVDE